MKLRARIAIVGLLGLAIFASSSGLAVAADFTAYGSLSGDLPYGAGSDEGDVYLWGSDELSLASADIGAIAVSDGTGDGYGQVSPYSSPIVGSRYRYLPYSSIAGADGTVKVSLMYAQQIFTVGNDQGKCWKIEAETPTGWYNGGTTYEVRPKWDYTWYSGTTNESHSGAGSYPAGDSGTESAMVIVIADRRPATDVYYYRVYHTRISPGCFAIGYKAGSTTTFNGSGGVYVRLSDNMVAYAPNGGGAGAGLGSTPLITSTAGGQFYAGYSTDPDVADYLIGTPPNYLDWSEAAIAGTYESTLPIDMPQIEIDESMETSGVPTGFDSFSPVAWWEWLSGRFESWVQAAADWFWFLDLFDLDEGGGWK